MCAPQGKVLIADSWFGSVTCALALYSVGLFCVMNVKTATKHYPKAELMEVVEEIKGKTAADKAARAVRRSAQVAYTREYSVGNKNVTLLAGGHNKKVPLLLIATYGSMLPGDTHSKTWQANMPDGSTKWYLKTTKQTIIHALYRKWFNIVDLHNKLRQGVVSMADVWKTKAWPERHFAEGIGFWEVNVYKACIYFWPRQFDGLTHGEFRMRLAWACMTLGKVPYPGNSMEGDAFYGKEGNKGAATPRCSTPTAPPPAHTPCHDIKRKAGSCPKTCAYCGQKGAYWLCECTGTAIYFCGNGRHSRTCQSDHIAGKPVKHTSWTMPTAGVKKAKRGRGRTSGSNADSDSSDSEAAGPSPNAAAQRRARGKAREEAVSTDE